MSRGLLDFMDRFTLEEAARQAAPEEKPQPGRRSAAAASRF
jgi:hypothetical protein